MAKALDPLSALVMVHQAKDTDMLRVRTYPRQTKRRWRTTCALHLQWLEFRRRHKGDAVKTRPGMIDLVIAKDDLVEKFRTSEYELAWLRAPTDQSWHECAHCRAEKHKR